MLDYALNYEDVVLTPKYSILPSRCIAETSCIFGNQIYALPIMPANMVCCLNTEIAHWLSENMYFYAMHRFNGKNNRKDLHWFIKKANQEKWRIISISLGVQEEDRDLLKWAFDQGYRLDYATIDIAHGHSVRMREMLEFTKQLYQGTTGRKPFIIGGNVGTTSAVLDLESWGADATKVGLAYGRACITKNKTGFATPMFSTILECARCAKKPIIADGAIRENGDIAKALVAGASMVMAGGLFAACTDSPADTIRDGNGFCKVYYGSASAENGNQKNIEGTAIKIPCNGMSYAEKMTEIMQDIQSACSYAGGTRLSSLSSVRWQILK